MVYVIILCMNDILILMIVMDIILNYIIILFYFTTEVSVSAVFADVM